MVKKFDRPLWRDIFLWVLLACYIAIIGGKLYQQPESMIPSHSIWDTDWEWLLLGGLGVMYLYLLATAVLACFYRPVTQGGADEDLPVCTVIVPAYNEGAHVAKTLYSLLECDYPADKLEIIAINDGSKDDTWDYILEAARRSGNRIQPVSLKRNGGKKHAIFLGVKAARGEIVVTVDSDSIINKDAIRELTKPFVDERIGAVAGGIRVQNPESNLVRTMLDVVLIFGCEFLRAAQSVTGLVLCTPGALSAYRKSAIEPVISEWLKQRFMGAPARIGEDRALATLLLRNNHLIVHQSTAVAYTCVPGTVTGAVKMLLRWTRGDIRENLVMTKFAFSNLTNKNVRSWVLLAYWVALMQNILLPFVFVPSFFYLLLSGNLNPAMFLGGNSLVSLLWAMIPAMIYARYTAPRKAIWALLYGLVCPFILSAIAVYSFLTLRDSRWMTRELPRMDKALAAERRVASGD